MTNAQLYEEIKRKKLVGEVAKSCGVSRNLICDVLRDGKESAYTGLIVSVANMAKDLHETMLNIRLEAAKEQFQNKEDCLHGLLAARINAGSPQCE